MNVFGALTNYSIQSGDGAHNLCIAFKVFTPLVHHVCMKVLCSIKNLSEHETFKKFKCSRPESCRDFHKPGPDGLAPIGTRCPEISSQDLSLASIKSAYHQYVP